MDRLKIEKAVEEISRKEDNLRWDLLINEIFKGDKIRYIWRSEIISLYHYIFYIFRNKDFSFSEIENDRIIFLVENELKRRKINFIKESTYHPRLSYQISIYSIYTEHITEEKIKKIKKMKENIKKEITCIRIDIKEKEAKIKEKWKIEKKEKRIDNIKEMISFLIWGFLIWFFYFGIWNFN